MHFPIFNDAVHRDMVTSKRNGDARLGPLAFQTGIKKIKIVIPRPEGDLCLAKYFDDSGNGFGKNFNLDG